MVAPSHSWRKRAVVQTDTPLTILRRHQVEARTGLSRSSIYAKLSKYGSNPQGYDPTFPQPVAIGARSIGWIEAEVEAWIALQVAKSRGIEGE